MKRYTNGFTLIEIAIVLVIIGLLLGGVLKGQELITGARVRNLISQQDGIKAAFFGFQDRYRALPGDYAAASTNINGVTIAGDGNGRIEGPNAPRHLRNAAGLEPSDRGGLPQRQLHPGHQRHEHADRQQQPEEPLQRLHSADLRQRVRHHRGQAAQAQPEDGQPSAGGDHGRGRPQGRRRSARCRWVPVLDLRPRRRRRTHRRNLRHRRHAIDLGHQPRKHELRRGQPVLSRRPVTPRRPAAVGGPGLN